MTTCQICGQPLTVTKAKLTVKGHGLYEACAEAQLDVDGRMAMQVRRGGIFLSKQNAPSELPAEYCKNCERLTLDLGGGPS